MTVTTVARAAGLSRSTILYYESIGLLRPAKRTRGNYRSYGEQDVRRLQQICVYRAAGLTLEDIRAILNQPNCDFASILRRRFVELGVEIERLREHQRAIGRLLKNTDKLRRKAMMNKEKWVEIMRASGFTEDDMHRWHSQFEKSAPQEHGEFLKFLRIPAPEVERIRDWSGRQSEQQRTP